jgi:hypothetical protein
MADRMLDSAAPRRETRPMDRARQAEAGRDEAVAARTPAADPLLTLQRQLGNRAFGRLLARQAKLPAQGPVTSGVSAPMSLADFRTAMAGFGVNTITVGDWDPGDPASIYRSVVDAFTDFKQSLGGTPPVKEVKFLRQASDPNAPADFGAGLLEVSKLIESRYKWLPAAKSVKGAKYPTIGGTVGGVTGQAGGAPLPAPALATSQRRIIVHELGHAVVEGMMTPGVKQPDPLDRDLIKRFKKAVGWFGNDLYDIQDAAVRSAIQSDQKPTAAPITHADWNDPKWGEQPITDYPLDGAHEDFPESLMAYIYAPDLLKARSPARFEFFAANKGSWSPILS